MRHVMWKIGDLATAAVTHHGTVYTIIAIKPDGLGLNDRHPVVRVSVDDHDLGSWFSSDLFTPWLGEPVDDTREYLDAVTNFVERTENEIS